jgi:hypothetical protein
MLDKEYIFEMARQRRMLSLIQRKGGVRRNTGGVSTSPLTLITDAPESEVLRTDDGEELTMDE